MGDDNAIFGCFFQTGFNPDRSEQEADNEVNLFRMYIWGSNGIDKELKKLRHKNYGKDFVLILFRFYVNPMSFELENIKELEGYRKKERSVACSIVVNDDNFFNKSEFERRSFLKNEVLRKLSLLEEVVKKKKLDTNTEKLRADVNNILATFELEQHAK